MFHTTMIHGRFQPFHIGHFEYLKTTLQITENNLIIGITNPTPDLTTQEVSSEHRHKSESNPFSFFMRQQMIRESIIQDDDTRNALEKISIVPFPIHNPNYWDNFFPKHAIQVMRLIEEWSHVKKARFIELGYRVHVLDGCRLTSGASIRSALKNGSSIDALVPKGTLNVLNSLDLKTIMKS